MKRRVAKFVCVCLCLLAALTWWIASSIAPLPTVVFSGDQPQCWGGFSPTGDSFATSDFDVAAGRPVLPLRLRSAADGRELSLLGTQDQATPPSDQTKASLLTGISWSPDGQSIAIQAAKSRIVGLEDPNDDLFVFDIHSSKERLHVKGDFLFPGLAEISPDGTRIAVQTGYKDDVDVREIDRPHSGVKYLAYHGNVVTVLIGPGSHSPIHQTHFSDSYFTKSSSHFVQCRQSNHRFEIVLIDCETQARITRNVSVNDAAISWDGKRLTLSPSSQKPEIFELGEGVPQTPICVHGLDVVRGKYGYLEVDFYSASNEIGVRTESDPQFAANNGLNWDIRQYSHWRRMNGTPTKAFAFHFTQWALSHDKRHSVACEIEQELPTSKPYGVLHWRDFSTLQNVRLKKLADPLTLKQLHISEHGEFIACNYSQAPFGTSSFEKVMRWLSEYSKTWWKYDLATELFHFGEQRCELWHGPTGQRIAVLPRHEFLEFSSNEKLFATYDRNRDLHLWNSVPNRNWKLAALIAAVPALLGAMTVVLLASFVMPIADRFRRQPQCQHSSVSVTQVD